VSPFFLCIGIISEYFNRVGNIPVGKDLLNIYADGDDINEILGMRKLAAKWVPKCLDAIRSMIVFASQAILNRFQLDPVF
jgi:hypothetical protein